MQMYCEITSNTYVEYTTIIEFKTVKKKQFRGKKYKKP